jgi:DNA repair exonuclease SbcCD ATPase subunit
MIRVESITIKEFRGIRDLTLDLKGKSFAVCGPNGTGKSGVVDALEFALTGDVSRLSGEGKGEVSLKRHGPHVDRRNDPDKARVTVRVTIPSLSKTVAIERSLKNPAAARVVPADSAVLEVLRQVEAHPEIVLSRRELIRYVLATPGKRAEEVQALLHLDQVEQVRVGLQKIANACEKQLVSLGTAVTLTRENLLRALGISELVKEKVLASANAQRMSLSLPALMDLTETPSLIFEPPARLSRKSAATTL